MTASPDHAAAAERAAAAAAGLNGKRNLASLMRLLVLAGLIYGVIVSIEASAAWPLALVVVLFLGFVVLAMVIGRIDDRQRHLAGLETYHSRGVERMDGCWTHGQDDGSGYLDGWHPYARDLDLVGPGGLYALLNTAASPIGRRTLADWLLHDDAVGDPVAQAGQVRALVPAHEWRAELAVRAAADYRRHGSDDAAGDWLRDRPSPPPAWLAGPVWLLRLCGIAALVLLTWNGGPEGLWLGLLGVAVLFWPLNALMIRRWCPGLDAERARAQSVVEARGLAQLARMPGDDQGLEELRQQARVGSTALDQLAAIFDSHAKRANFLWQLLGSVVLVEWRNVRRLHTWAAAHAEHRPAWLAALGQGEALSCLATYAAEQGGCWAEYHRGGDGLAFAAEDLTHPLLPRASRVGNDLSLTEGQVLMLTGANASGKSTFLRAIALAELLAGLGAPVCAARCRVRGMRLATVMRVQDDLLHGRSRFQAEVETLRLVLDRIGDRDQPAMLVLDEILGGTNSRERHQGTKAIIEHLRGHAGLVLVSTHDLELTRLAEADPDRFHLAFFADRAVLGETASHDDETGPDVVFDYRLRAGVLQSTNALRVMRAAGLPVEG